LNLPLALQSFASKVEPESKVEGKKAPKAEGKKAPKVEGKKAPEDAPPANLGWDSHSAVVS
jgi:hypothetical protein